MAGLPVASGGLDVAAPLDLKPWLLLAAFVGFLVDGLASLWLGRAPRFARPVAAAMLLAGALAGAALVGGRAFADEAAPISNRDAEAARSTHLAYIVTGDAAVDETSRLGLEISRACSTNAPRRKSRPGRARSRARRIQLLSPNLLAGRRRAAAASAGAVARIAAFMKNGGTVVFDTRDALTARPGGPPTPEGLWLRTLLAGVDVPELEPVPRDHVITKTFYLIDNFIGRTDSGQTWVEALPPPDPNDRAPRPARAGDNVSPIVIASNDLAAAWAVDADGRALYPLVPGARANANWRCAAASTS